MFNFTHKANRYKRGLFNQQAAEMWVYRQVERPLIALHAIDNSAARYVDTAAVKALTQKPVSTAKHNLKNQILKHPNQARIRVQGTYIEKIFSPILKGYKPINGMQYFFKNPYDSFYNEKEYLQPTDRFPSGMSPIDTPENYKPVYEHRITRHKIPESLLTKAGKRIDRREQAKQLILPMMFINSGLAYLSTALPQVERFKLPYSLVVGYTTPWITWGSLNTLGSRKTIQKLETIGVKSLYKLASLIPPKNR
jgi:hypothetical protein